MKRVLTGIITSNKTKDTVVVAVERVLQHPKYLRRYKRHKKYKAQTLGNLSIGDKVEIIECKPLSKDKKWKVIKLITAAKKVEEVEDFKEELEGLEKPEESEELK
jgi:small subunit ribosomal protein S17